MSAEIDGPSRVVPSQPVKRLDPVPRKRQEQEREENPEDEAPVAPEEDTQDDSPQGKSVTGGSDAFWGALLVARLGGKPWPLCVRFAHEVAALKLRVVGHVEHMVNREPIYRRLEGQITPER